MSENYPSLSSSAEFQATYEEKPKCGHAPEQVMFADINELLQLLAMCCKLQVDLEAALDVVNDIDIDSQLINLPRKLGSIQKSCTDILKWTTRFKRMLATHTFALIINSEVRHQKPYALPV